MYLTTVSIFALIKDNFFSRFCLMISRKEMRQLVEDVGDPFSAVCVSRFCRAVHRFSESDRVGNRTVHWELSQSKITVRHRKSGSTGKTISYSIGLQFTNLPSHGSRLWWSCPSCRARVDALYLLPERERMECRKCCGLVYGSQYLPRTIKKRQRRTSR
jgi:hypothetical protein